MRQAKLGRYGFTRTDERASMDPDLDSTAAVYLAT